MVINISMRLQAVNARVAAGEQVRTNAQAVIYLSS